MNPIPQDNCPLCNSPLHFIFARDKEKKTCIGCEDYYIHYHISGLIKFVDFVIDEYKVLNDYDDYGADDLSRLLRGRTRAFKYDAESQSTSDMVFIRNGGIDWDFSSRDKLQSKLQMLLVFQ